MDTLAFGYILPTTGRIRDFNPLETCAARRTQKRIPTGIPEEILFDLSDSIRYDFYSAFLPAAALKVSAMLAMPCSSAGSRMVVA